MSLKAFEDKASRNFAILTLAMIAKNTAKLEPEKIKLFDEVITALQANNFEGLSKDAINELEQLSKLI